MRELKINFLFPLATLIILIYSFSSQLFSIAPLGKLLDPFSGAVQNAQEQQLFANDLKIDQLKISEDITVYFDERKVPHIYANNDKDLFFAQGYVTAYLRLWQMDFITYSVAGRLSEILEDKGMEDYDRIQRRLGILESARKTLALMEKDEETISALNAYSDGVNAFIESLDYKDLPLEYKLMDYKPEAWSPLKSILVLKSMADALTGYEEDFFLSRMMLALGEEDFNLLFPDFTAYSTPVMNVDKPEFQKTFNANKKPDYLNYAFFNSKKIEKKSRYNPRLGSNSWAVSGNKTKTGFPILACDPHLSLSMPNIWLEMQLNAPGLNVYGVSIPGTPAVIIGFNKDIAWGTTNGSDDVKDWYKLKISKDYKKYQYNGEWVDFEIRVEEIKRKNQAPLYDTIYYSIHGPVVTTNEFKGYYGENTIDHALKWELHNPSNEFKTFIQLNKASNYQEYKAAIKDYKCPIQNFTFASKDNTIAINHQGNMAMKWPGQGKFVLDGSRAEDLSTSYIPVDSLPHIYNPECNYVLSANQTPTYGDYPFYYNGDYAETRANRIKQLLEKDSVFDISKTKAIQLDNVNAFAVEVLPQLIKNIDQTQLDATNKEILNQISAWDGAYTLEEKSARLFESWWIKTQKYTWDELDDLNFFKTPPDNYVLLDLIKNDPTNRYFDRQSTTEKEKVQDIITLAFKDACKGYQRLLKRNRTAWKDFNRVEINHLTNIPAFGEMNLTSSGHPDAINAISKNWGPSWRMVVQLGETPEAYGIYPGGQSGNIGSPFYNNAIKDWNQGKYYKLNFYTSKEEAEKNSSNSWNLKKK